MKKIVLFVAAICLSFTSLSSFASANALTNLIDGGIGQVGGSNCHMVYPSTPNFCTVFTTSAKCTCLYSCIYVHHRVKAACYLVCATMVSIYGALRAEGNPHTIKGGCDYAYPNDQTKAKNCTNDWYCYEYGVDYSGNKCKGISSGGVC